MSESLQPEEHSICANCQQENEASTHYCKSCGEPLLEGKLAGSCRLIERIGSGGVGVVYRAEHVRLGTSFAVKLLNRSLASDPKVVERFLHEAKITSQLTHEHIIFISDYGEMKGFGPYMTMEFLKGQTLEDYIEQRIELPLERILLAMIQVCDAMHCAHENNLIHRDLKPSNIFMLEREPGQGDFIKLLDFGIAKSLEASDDQKLTKTGTVLGTPLYMAPEQGFSQVELDHLIDIYAVGAILFELTTGYLPFIGATAMEIALQKAKEEAPLISHYKPLLEGTLLEALIAQCLQRRRADRIQSALEVKHVLQKIHEDMLEKRKSSSARRRRRTSSSGSPPPKDHISVEPPGFVGLGDENHEPTDRGTMRIETDAYVPGAGGTLPSGEAFHQVPSERTATEISPYPRANTTDTLHSKGLPSGTPDDFRTRPEFPRSDDFLSEKTTPEFFPERRAETVPYGSSIKKFTPSGTEIWESPKSPPPPDSAPPHLRRDSSPPRQHPSNRPVSHPPQARTDGRLFYTLFFGVGFVLLGITVVLVVMLYNKRQREKNLQEPTKRRLIVVKRTEPRKQKSVHMAGVTGPEARREVPVRREATTPEPRRAIKKARAVFKRARPKARIRKRRRPNRVKPRSRILRRIAPKVVERVVPKVVVRKPPVRRVVLKGFADGCPENWGGKKWVRLILSESGVGVNAGGVKKGKKRNNWCIPVRGKSTKVEIDGAGKGLALCEFRLRSSETRRVIRIHLKDAEDQDPGSYCFKR